MSDGNDWIDWHGGDCPVDPETVVNVWMRDEENIDAKNIELPPREWTWNHMDDDGDIIKYRIVGAAK